MLPPPPQAVPALVEGIVEWYNSAPSVVRAVLFHLVFEDIHPFQDGNGRTGRIVLDHMLMALGYPVIALKADREGAQAYHRAVHEFAETVDARDGSALLRLVEQAIDAALAKELARLSYAEQRRAARFHSASRK